MNNLLIFIKLNCSAPAVQPAISFVEDSYNNQHEHFYYTSDKDTQTIRDLLSSMKIDNLVDYYIAFIEYRKTPEIFIKKINYPVTPRQKRSRCRSNRGIIDSPTPLFTPFCRFRYRSRGQIHSHQYPRTSSTNDPFLK